MSLTARDTLRARAVPAWRVARWTIAALSYPLCLAAAGYFWYDVSWYLNEHFCPPGRSGHYGAERDFACLWPLWVSMVKDTLCAIVAASIAITPPALMAPARRFATALVTGLVTAALWLTVQYGHYSADHHVWAHQISVAAVFVSTLALITSAFWYAGARSR